LKNYALYNSHLKRNTLRGGQFQGNLIPSPPPVTYHISGLILDKNELLTTLDNEYELEFDPKYEFKFRECLSNLDTSHPALKITYTQDPIFKAKLINLAEKTPDFFRDVIRKEAAQFARLMEIEVDVPLWREASARQRGPRKQPILHMEEIKKQIELMLKHNIIRPSTADRFSQVLLAKKPNGKFRFCIDYRLLNLHTRSGRWPLPNIKEIFGRIADKRPKFFAILDATSGFHQALLNLNSVQFTAFICFMGTYEFLRVPFGLKGAPSFYQEAMAGLLGGLLYECCELYLDDIIVYATSQEELLINLGKVINRLNEKGVTANPEKCRFGFEEIEYVGHIINKYGLTMSLEKIRKVFDFPQPIISKQLKSFLGLTNYFRDHVRNYSTITYPLQRMLVDYVRTRDLVWTPKTIEAFNTVKNSISNCQLLFFPNNDDPVFVHTDASDYGIGAYIFQLTAGVEKPIHFISKSFSGAECNWSTIEKECFAIYYTLKQLEYLLLYRPFTLRTDHKNLLYMNDSGSKKVINWKLEIQHFDFKVEHISGVKNEVADAFSRLVEDNTIRTSNIAYGLSALQISKGNFRTKGTFERKTLPSMIYKRIRQVHNSFACHHGVRITRQKLALNNIKWPYMDKDISTFIKLCPVCQKLSVVKPENVTEPFTLSSYKPMHRISIDTVVKLPLDSRGNTNIIVIIDNFSRFVTLHPEPDISAKSAVHAFLCHLGFFGSVKEIQSDGGGQYVSDIMHEFTTLVGVDHFVSTAHSHEENAIVERAIKEVNRHLRAIIYDRNIYDDWSILLPLVQRIMNSTFHSSIGCSPSQIIFGDAIDLNRDIFVKSTNEILPTIPISEYNTKLVEKQALIISMAQKLREEDDKNNKIKRKLDKPLTSYPVGSYVLLSYPDNDRPRTRLDTIWSGPYLIQSISNSQYTIVNLITERTARVHVSRLKSFQFDPTVTIPRDVARRDTNSFIVEKILSHTGTPTMKSQMDFKVRWLGYGAEDDLWLPWKELRDNNALHKYLFEHGLKKLIPIDHVKDNYDFTLEDFYV
jgi:hypothetical protein